MCLYALGDEGLAPGDVVDLSVDESRTESGGEHDDMVLVGEGIGHLLGEVACLSAQLVDADAEGCEALEVHQEVVDEVLDAPVVAPSDDAAEGDTVDGAEGMVADECHGGGIGGQLVEALNGERHAELVDGALTEVDAFAPLDEVGVDEILMNEALKPAREETGYPACMLASPLAHDFVNVDGQVVVHRLWDSLIDGELAVVDEIGAARQSAEPIGAFGEAEGGIEGAAGVVDGQQLCVAAGDAEVPALLMDLDGRGRRHHAVAQIGQVGGRCGQAMGDGAAAEGVALLYVGSQAGWHEGEQQYCDECAQETGVRECGGWIHAVFVSRFGAKVVKSLESGGSNRHFFRVYGLFL